VGPRASLDSVEKRKFFILPGLELRPLGRPARSQSLYRLSYPGSFVSCSIQNSLRKSEYFLQYALDCMDGKAITE
jgi:hypothetical protein